MDTKVIQGLLITTCGFLVLGIILTLVDLPHYKYEGGVSMARAAVPVRTAPPPMAAPAETPGATTAAPAPAEPE